MVAGVAKILALWCSSPRKTSIFDVIAINRYCYARIGLRILFLTVLFVLLCTLQRFVHARPHGHSKRTGKETASLIWFPTRGIHVRLTGLISGITRQEYTVKAMMLIN